MMTMNELGLQKKDLSFQNYDQFAESILENNVRVNLKSNTPG